MNVSGINSNTVVSPTSTGGGQKPPIKPVEEVSQKVTEGVTVTLGQVQEESPVYTANSTGGGQKPPIKQY